ncbi:ATP-dependent DNA helicase PIF1 [Mycena chlorophos]|uniref:ATP-dependent DNA helicase PIF1 n=1 Tax=Mycena chlorophos TaxID=658473 RepID=A0A8H6SZQ5_MYCCL|nr:ATP-dependent DNA helicase PIF1 [Mycena chlorophos]
MSVDVPAVAAVSHSQSSPPPVTIMVPPSSSGSNSSTTSLVAGHDSGPNGDVDPQILEALLGKDRIYVLKLGESMEGLITDRSPSRQRLDLTPATSYQRMLVHRCAAYYSLSPETDSLSKVISVAITAESRIPARRISDLSPPPVETPPKFKIMMRKPMSQASSVTGDDGDVSDVEASETGSLGGRSSASASKPRMTIEERTAAYNEARNRIFIDFDEKDQSSASSSASLVSGSSTSASGDDPGSPATESEWSGPSTKKHPPHRASSTSSSRSLRSSAPAFMSSNSSSSSRNSRAPSPAFKYPTLYEPPPLPGAGMAIPVPPFVDASGYPSAVPQQPPQPIPYYPQYHQPMPPGQQPPQPTFMAPYPYHYSAPYPPYSHPPTPGSEPEMYPYHHPSAQYWVPQQQNGGSPPPHPPQSHPHHVNGSPQPMQPYGPAMRFPVNGYAPGQPYYGPPPPPAHMPVPQYMSPPPQTQPLPSFEPPRINGRSASNGNSNNRRNGSVGKGRPGPQPQRAAWSYGPGISGGVDFPSTTGSSAVGPRLSGNMSPGHGGGMPMRRGSSGNRTTSGSGSSAGDDVSSVASSSTTSSSSRRTYTSTASSTQHHPLPARPDWAVGLRPNPTLHAPRRDHDTSRASSSGNSSPHGPGPVPPALTDFPPLSGQAGSASGSGAGPSAPKPAPATGAWTNASSTRSIVMAVTHDPKITLARRPTSSAGQNKDKDKARGDAVANAILVNQASALSLEDRPELAAAAVSSMSCPPKDAPAAAVGG